MPCSGEVYGEDNGRASDGYSGNLGMSRGEGGVVGQ